MRPSRIPAPLKSPALASDEARSSFRAKTIATRLTPEELREIEAAAEGEGKTVAEWLRDLALRSVRQRPADPIELLGDTSRKGNLRTLRSTEAALSVP